MKKITYDRYGQEAKVYTITESEFKNATQTWANNTPYWCKRVQAMLSQKFTFCETPDEYKSYVEIYYDEKEGLEFGLRVLSDEISQIFLLKGDPRFDREVETFDIGRLPTLDEWLDYKNEEMHTMISETKKRLRSPKKYEEKPDVDGLIGDKKNETN